MSQTDQYQLKYIFLIFYSIIILNIYFISVKQTFKTANI